MIFIPYNNSKYAIFVEEKMGQLLQIENIAKEVYFKHAVLWLASRVVFTVILVFCLSIFVLYEGVNTFLYTKCRELFMHNITWLNRTILALGLVSFFSDFGSEMATSVLPSFLVSLGASAAFLGFLEGIANAGNSFTSIIAGWASDYTARRKPFAALGYLLASLGVGSLFFAHQWYQIIMARILTRIGKGVREPARDVLLVHAARPEVYGRMFGFHRMMDNLGAILGPLVTLILLRFISIPIIFLVAFIPVFISFLIIVCVIHDVKSQESKIRIHTNQFASMPPVFKKYVIAVGVFGLGNCAASLLILRTIGFLKPLLGTASADWYSILFYTLFNCFYALFSYPVGYLADRIGKKAVLISGYILMAFGLFGFGLNITSLSNIFVLFLITGSAYAIIDGVQRAVAADILPHEIQGTGYGILAAVTGLGSLFSSMIVGFLWSSISPLIGFTYAALLCVMGALLMARVPTTR